MVDRAKVQDFAYKGKILMFYSTRRGVINLILKCHNLSLIFTFHTHRDYFYGIVAEMPHLYCTVHVLHILVCFPWNWTSTCVGLLARAPKLMTQ